MMALQSQMNNEIIKKNHIHEAVGKKLGWIMMKKRAD
jgi:hypothetical protein